MSEALAPRRRKTVRVLQILGGVTLVALVGLGLHRTAEGQSKNGKGGKPEPAVVPVIVTEVATHDLPIYLEGLGTVIASNTVTVKPQVDGRLLSVHYTEGQNVKQGDVLVEIDPQPFQVQVDIAEAAIGRDEAQLAAANKTYARDVELAKNGIVTEQQVDDQRASVAQHQGEVRVDRAQAENARLELDYAKVKSPIDGVVGVRLVDAGNIVHASDPSGLVVVTELDPIAVIFTLPEDDLAEISQAMAAGKVTVDALARDGQTNLGSGELKVIDNQINSATATLKLKAMFTNPERKLWPNQFVKARLLLTTKRDALVIPAAAVQRGPNGTLVYVVGDGDIARAQPIEVDRIEGDTAAIRSGLKKGDRVVVDGMGQLKPGGKVSPREQGADQKGDEQQGGADDKSKGKQ